MHTHCSVDFPTTPSPLPSACIHLTYSVPPLPASAPCYHGRNNADITLIMQFYQLGGELLGDLLFLATNQQDQVNEACTYVQRLCLRMLLQCICICVCKGWFYPENEAGLHVKAKATKATSVCLPCSPWSAHTENIASLPYTNRIEI